MKFCLEPPPASCALPVASNWRSACSFFAIYLLMLSALALHAQGPQVTTWRYDNAHSGINAQETQLTPANVNANTFGKLFSVAVDGQVYAQPLYMPGLNMPDGKTHNVVFIATEHDSVYAMDADSNLGANAQPLWKASMISPSHGAGPGATTVPYQDVLIDDINPEIGITSTPVIDPASQTIYVVAKSKENGSYVQRLHALSLFDGSEKSGSPVQLQASVPGTGDGSANGTLTFNALWELNRPALDLFNGHLYIFFGSHGDNGPFHGWMMVYDAKTLNQTAAASFSPNGSANSVWMSGAGLFIDTVDPNGRGFLMTGNGDFTPYAVPPSTLTDYGNSILRLDLSNGAITVSDAFTPFNQSTLNTHDRDLGSGGMVLLPDQPGAHPHELVTAGKDGRILVLDRDNLGGYANGASSNTNIVQDIPDQLGSGGMWASPIYWNGVVYFWSTFSGLRTFPVTNGLLSTASTSQSTAGALFPSPTPSLSANGTQDAILWAIRADQFATGGNSVLYAFDPSNIRTELYNSTQNAARDTAGQAVKFSVPVVSNGKVYVGAGYELDVYGLLNGAVQAPSPVITPDGGDFEVASETVSLSDSISGTSIYYTTDGSTASSSSTLYTGPFQLTGNATVQAIALAAGYLQSPTSQAIFEVSTQPPAPVLSPGSGVFTAAVTATLTDSQSNATIYYTTDGSTPTTSSTLYTGPITVSATGTVNAISVAPGLSPSSITSGTYSIYPGGVGLDFSTGFASTTGLQLNGNAIRAADNTLQLTGDAYFQDGSAFTTTPINIQAFATEFTFQITDPYADGFTFTIQNTSPAALGANGCGLGYGAGVRGGTGGIPNSVAVKFDLYSNNGEGADSTGLYEDGASPTVPAIDMTSSGINLHSGDVMTANITYDGLTLTLNIIDLVTGAHFSQAFKGYLPSVLGSNTAYVGFTGGTGAKRYSTQKVQDWTFVSLGATGTQAPTFSPAAGSYTGTQMVSLASGTSSALIYYTTDGSTPSASSAQYSAPISVSSNEAINAIAVAGGSTSPISHARYTIAAPVTAPPAFSPPPGVYSATQTVTLGSATSGAAVYYTTDGSTPSTASSLYAAPLTVAATQTINALAIAPGDTPSPISSGSYTIAVGASSTINFSGGFATIAGLRLNGNALQASDNTLELTSGAPAEKSSVFWATPVNIQAFSTEFTFQLTSALADGFTFTIQNNAPTALGTNGSGLGYGAATLGGTGGIPNSAAIKFDLYNNYGEGADSTGLYENGASPTTPAIDMTSSGINLHSGDIMTATLTYDGLTLTLTIDDPTAGATFTHAFPVDLATALGSDTAYVGFTAGNGGKAAIQKIQSWTFASTATGTQAPVFTPPGGTYTGTQMVALVSATSGALIYYTTDGSTPSASSTEYTTPLTISSAETINAIAVAGGSTSTVASASYIITAPATAPPTFSPPPGAFSAAQTVALSSATPGAAIYYTIDGSTPTTASTLYTAPLAISATKTINAFAIAPEDTPSPAATGIYTISAGPTIDFSSGFSSITGLQLNGSAFQSSSNTLELTNGGPAEKGSVFWTTPVNIQAFSTKFVFQLTSAVADGFTFTIQNNAPTALGAAGSGLGYGAGIVGGTGGIQKSAAVKFDLYSNNGEGTDSTGLYENGASPTTPAIDMTASGINLRSGDIMTAILSYDGVKLTVTVNDPTSGATFTQAFPVSLTSVIGSNTAYVGFTGGDGGKTAIQQIQSWTFASTGPGG